MKLIGIAGTNGSGKDSVGQILQDDYGFLFVSVTEILREELIRRGQTPQREYLRQLSAQWRQQEGLGILVDKAIDIYKAQSKEYKGLVISSIRNVGEVEHIHELGGKVIWVDADPKIRYERITSRARSAEDKKTFEEFLAEEKAEMLPGEDETSLHMAGVKSKADIFIENNFEDFNSLKVELKKILNSAE